MKVTLFTIPTPVITSIQVATTMTTIFPQKLSSKGICGDISNHQNKIIIMMMIIESKHRTLFTILLFVFELVFPFSSVAIVKI